LNVHWLHVEISAFSGVWTCVREMTVVKRSVDLNRNENGIENGKASESASLNAAAWLMCDYFDRNHDDAALSFVEVHPASDFHPHLFECICSSDDRSIFPFACFAIHSRPQLGCSSVGCQAVAAKLAMNVMKPSSHDHHGLADCPNDSNHSLKRCAGLVRQPNSSHDHETNRARLLQDVSLPSRTALGGDSLRPVRYTPTVRFDTNDFHALKSDVEVEPTQVLGDKTMHRK
jgi:hypothetical protein